MVFVFTALAVVSIAMDSGVVGRKSEPLVSSRREKDATPAVSVLTTPLAEREGSREEESTTSSPLSEVDEMHEATDGPEHGHFATTAPDPALAADEELATVAPSTAANASVAELKESGADDPGDTQEVPYYFFNFPISVKFTGTSGAKSTVVLLDRLPIGEINSNFVYIYPLVLFTVYTLVWAVCCMRSNRTGLSFRLICEAATCFMCLWADLATKHKVITATRAWSYILILIGLLSAWNVAAMLTKGTPNEDVCYYVFQTLVVLAWLVYSVERMFVRKYYRRTVDPMSGDHYCADCASHVCCGQFTALQEAQFMAEVSVDDTLNGRKGALADKGQKW